MRRAYQSGANRQAPPVPDSPSVSYPAAGNAGAGTAGTVIGPHWFHMVTEAIITVIERARLTPDDTPVQFREAVRQLIRERATLDGSVFTAPTRYASSVSLPDNDNTKKLATAEWVRRHTYAYLFDFRRFVPEAASFGFGNHKITDVTLTASTPTRGQPGHSIQTGKRNIHLTFELTTERDHR